MENQFYTEHTSEISLLEAAGKINAQGFHISGAVFSLHDKIENILPSLTEGRGKIKGFKVTSKSPYLIELPLKQTITPLKRKIGKAFFWEDKEKRIGYFLSSQGKDEFSELLHSIHSFLLPDLCKVFLRTRELRNSLDSFVREVKGVSLRVLEYVSRSIIECPKSTKKRVRTNRQWTDEDYSDVFNKLAEGKQWLSSIKLEALGSSFASVRICKDATFCCHKGFSFFFDNLIRYISSSIIQSRDFFDRRDRQNSPTGMSRPLRINYKEDIFADKYQNHRLIKTLSRFKDSCISVFHPNPYLHASICDYLDGSSYEIWVTTSSSILLIPRYKATAQSIERVCNHICDEFEEGIIEENMQ